MASIPEVISPPGSGSKIKWRLPRTAVGGGDPNITSGFCTSYSSTFVVGPAGAARAPPQAREQYDRVAGVNSGIASKGAHVSAISEIVQPGEGQIRDYVSTEKTQDNAWAAGRFQTSSAAAYQPVTDLPPPSDNHKSALAEPSNILSMVREAPAEPPARKRGTALSCLGYDISEDIEEEDDIPEPLLQPITRDLPTTKLLSPPAESKPKSREEGAYWAEMAASDDPSMRKATSASTQFAEPPHLDAEGDAAEMAARAYLSMNHSPSGAKQNTKAPRSAFVAESNGADSLGWEEGERPRVTQAQARRMLRADALGLLEAMDDGPDRWTTVYGSTVGPVSAVARAEKVAGVQRPTKSGTSAYVRQEKGASTFSSLGE